jgi:hypothetical protein
MGENAEMSELQELRVLLEQNKEAIQNLRVMIENMEVLLASFQTEGLENHTARSSGYRSGPQT